MARSTPAGRWAAGVLAALALATASCGKFTREERLPDSGATLEGTVKFGDEPVQFAMILVQTSSSSATGKVGEDGRYRVENVPLGEVKVGVNTAAAQGEFQSKMMSAGVYKGPEAKGKGRVSGLKFIQVPDKYHNPETSGLKTTVNKGSNTYDIAIPK
jgi:hypothetical protein